MSSFYDELNDSIGGDVTDQLRSRYGLDPDQARGALEAVGPLVLSGLKRQQDEGGEERLGDLLNQHGKADALEDLGGYFDQQNDDDLDPALGGILGDRGAEAGQMMEQKLGLSAGMGAKLIPMLAPLIMGMLLKKGKGGGAGSSGGGGGMGMIGGLLDKDGDGNILDDLGGMLFKGGGGLASVAGGAAKSGCLGMLLGGKK
jgi:hypothetical protein